MPRGRGHPNAYTDIGNCHCLVNDMALTLIVPVKSQNGDQRSSLVATPAFPKTRTVESCKLTGITR